VVENRSGLGPKKHVYLLVAIQKLRGVTRFSFCEVIFSYVAPEYLLILPASAVYENEIPRMTLLVVYNITF
jgi:hypothetical protein